MEPKTQNLRRYSHLLKQPVEPEIEFLLKLCALATTLLHPKSKVNRRVKCSLNPTYMG